MKRNNLAKLAFALVFSLMTTISYAAVPNTINYQGFLTDATTGQPQNTTVNVTFELYDALVGGFLMYSETQTVTPVNGNFNAQIGTGYSGFGPLPFYAVRFDKPYWLQITLGTQVLAPRQPLASSATALRAGVADSLAPVPYLGLDSVNVSNFAAGSGALQMNYAGVSNSAIGESALAKNFAGNYNTAGGGQALFSNTNANGNVGVGYQALYSQSFKNAGIAWDSSNTALGTQALFTNNPTSFTNGIFNTAVGGKGLYSNSTGGFNIALGYQAGSSLTVGNYNIDIGNFGIAGEGNTIRIGDANQTRSFVSGIYGVKPTNALPYPVVVDSAGQLGSALTLQVPGANQWDLNSTEGDFKVGGSSIRLKVAVPIDGGGAGDIAIKADGGQSHLSLIAAGGTAVYSNTSRTAGVTLGAGGNSWTSVSDRAAKHDIIPLNASSILAKVAEMPLYAWKYNSEVSGANHVGPMAQDFRAAFGLGDNDKTITSVDADGVALAAIKGLYEKLVQTEKNSRAKDKKINQLARELAAIKAKLGLK